VLVVKIKVPQKMLATVVTGRVEIMYLPGKSNRNADALSKQK